MSRAVAFATILCRSGRQKSALYFKRGGDIYLTFFWILVERVSVAGFVVTRNNDTLRGQIDYRDWDLNPARIVFRESENGSSRSGLFAGAGALFIVPRNREKLSFVADLGWQHLHSVSDPYTDAYGSATGHIDYSLVKLDILFRYRYPMGGIRPVVEGGMSNALALGMNCYQTIVQGSGNPANTGAMLYGSFRKHQEGWILGAGVSGKRWTVEGRYEAGTGISGSTDVTSPVKTWYLLVSYAL